MSDTIAPPATVDLFDESHGPEERPATIRKDKPPAEPVETPPGLEPDNDLPTRAEAVAAEKAAVAAEAAEEEDEGPPPPDLHIIAPDEVQIDIAGCRCTVKRMKARESLYFVRIILTGAQDFLSTDMFSGPSDEVVGGLVAALVLAIPNAPDEFLSLVHHIVEPVDEDDKATVVEELANPDLDSLMLVVEAVATQESESLTELVGKVRAAWKRVQPLYGRLRKSQKTS